VQIRVAPCAAVRRISRRDLLKEGSAAAALLALGAGAPAAPAAGRAALSARRRAVYAALMRALQGAPDGALRHADPALAARAFAGWYAGQPPAIRLHADAVLDHLDALGLRRAGREGLGALCRWSDAGTGSPSAEHAVNCAAVAAAVALAAQSASPAPEPDDAPVVCALAAVPA
jgi:hypothetical protein